MKHSKRIQTLILITALLCAPLIAADARLSPRFRTVYILEMSNGLDQHLANRLTSSGVLWVVLEPKSADAVLTESLDESFWTWLAQTYPPAPGAPVTRWPRVGHPAESPLANSRRPGMVFLVDPRAGGALVRLGSSSESIPDELDHSAERIANQLKTAFGRNSPAQASRVFFKTPGRLRTSARGGA